MPIHGYPGNVITANPTAPTSSVASGVWTTEQQLIAKAAGNWPLYIPPYQISRSLRFNSADSTYLTRTPATASGQNQWTFSCWFKRVSPGTSQFFIGGNITTSGSIRDEFVVGIGSDDKLFVSAFTNASGYYFNRFSAAVYRDVSAWYHLVIQFDPDNGTSANRVIAYINGVQVTWGSSADSGAAGSIGSSAYRSINNTYRNDIGGGYQGGGVPVYFSNTYMAEVYMVSGSIIAYTNFGETNTSTGVWQAKAYSGSYGTNGFYLNFSDNSNTTAATLGKDYSGNGNNWTPNNFSVTAGAGNDSLVDSPASYSPGDTGVGGQVRGNYCTLNPLNNPGSSTISNGNLDVVTASGTAGRVVGTFGVSSGKWYWEIVGTSIISGESSIGIAAASTSSSALLGNETTSYAYYSDGNKRTNSSFSAYGASYTNNDVIGVALDLDAGTLTFYKNNASQGTAFSSISGTFVPALSDGSSSNSSTFVCNFGQRPFAYTAPSGFSCLVTTNLPTPTIGATSTTQAGKYMNVVLYTGNGTTNAITGVGFQPDFVWLKSRSGATTNHALFDAVRGVGYNLRSNTTEAEAIPSPNDSLTAFNSDGFTLGANANSGAPNINFTVGGTYVGWNWNAGGSTVTNTSGTISAQVRANTTSGFSIVTYTGNGNAYPTGATVGHGLGVAPSMVIIKCRGTSATFWPVYHISTGATSHVVLNNAVAVGATDAFNRTNPTSTVFSVGQNVPSNETNASGGTYVAYCFAPVAGYSVFGSYTGNGSADGPFVYLGFRPAFLMLKRTDSTGDWMMKDFRRDGYNVVKPALFANLSDAEYSDALNLDLISNGFKLRNAFANSNANTGTYIYMAFAEFPFKYSLAE